MTDVDSEIQELEARLSQLRLQKATQPAAVAEEGSHTCGHFRQPTVSVHREVATSRMLLATLIGRLMPIGIAQFYRKC